MEQVEDDKAGEVAKDKQLMETKEESVMEQVEDDKAGEVAKEKQIMETKEESMMEQVEDHDKGDQVAKEKQITESEEDLSWTDVFFGHNNPISMLMEELEDSVMEQVEDDKAEEVAKEKQIMETKEESMMEQVEDHDKGDQVGKEKQITESEKDLSWTDEFFSHKHPISMLMEKQEDSVMEQMEDDKAEEVAKEKQIMETKEESMMEQVEDHDKGDQVAQEKQVTESEEDLSWIDEFFGHKHPISMLMEKQEDSVMEQVEDDKVGEVAKEKQIMETKEESMMEQVEDDDKGDQVGKEKQITEETEEDLSWRVAFFSHKHPIIMLIEEEGEEGTHICHNCDNPIVKKYFFSSKEELFGCRQCNIFLHRECADKGLCLKIHHTYHSAGPLALKEIESPYTCLSCLKYYEPPGLFFQDRSKGFFESLKFWESNFSLCVECSFRKPNIKLADHDHLLTFLNGGFNRNQSISCKACKEKCQHFVFRCVNCDINFHLSCFPSLPRTIKHKCHIDPMSLITDQKLVKWDEGYDEFYCDACEEQRNPKFPVYCCAICPFVAHVECVFSEVMPAVCTAEIEELEIHPVEKSLADLTGDEAMAREFFARLRVEKKGEEIKGPKYENQAEDLEEQIQKVLKEITDHNLVKDLDEQILKLQREIIEEKEIRDTAEREFERAKEKLNDLNEKLEEVKEERAEVLRVQHQI